MFQHFFCSCFFPRIRAKAHPMNPLTSPEVKGKGPLDFEEVLRECPRFRVLVVGRANSGKTTIISKMCGADGLPIIRDEMGKEYFASDREYPTPGIRLEITYGSNPSFVFHDSLGFEAGSVSEFESVKDFIKESLEKPKLQDRLHAIWYCVPTDSTRVMSDAELAFFKEDTGDIPVILLFTKWDGMVIRNYSMLRNEMGMGMSQAMEEADKHSANVLKDEYIPLFQRTPHPPASYVTLGGMDSSETKCSELAEKTAAALTAGLLKKLFVSVQTQNLEICVKHGISEAVSKCILPRPVGENSDHAEIMSSLLSWFPHMNFGDDQHRFKHWLLRQRNFDGSDLARYREIRTEILTLLNPIISNSEEAFSSPRLQAFNTVTCAAILALRSFGLSQGSSYTVKAAIEECLANLPYDAIKDAINSAPSMRMYARSFTLSLLEKTPKEISDELTQICLETPLR